MSAHGSEAPAKGTSSGGFATPPGLILLTRIAASNARQTRAQVTQDLAPLFTHKLSPQDWKRLAEREIGQLIASGFVAESKSDLSLTPEGEIAVAAYLGFKSFEPRSWPEFRDILLVAKSLGLEKEPATRLKSMARIEGLRTILVQRSFGLSIKKNQPPAKLRAQLAVLALERAFGNRIKAGIGKGSSLSAKAGRLLAGQLCRQPRSFSTDLKLIAELAADAAGTTDQSLDGLRLGVLRNLGARAIETANERIAVDVKPARAPIPIRSSDPPPVLAPAANDKAPKALEPPAPHRPDMAEFSEAVKRAAMKRAEGWAGSRKAFISHVWDAIQATETRWGLSEIEFKCMLAEAHRLGAVVLANADLKDKKSMKDLESSAVPYKNTVWHFVRVED